MALATRMLDGEKIEPKLSARCAASSEMAASALIRETGVKAAPMWAPIPARDCHGPTRPRDAGGDNYYVENTDQVMMDLRAITPRLSPILQATALCMRNEALAP